MNNQKLHYTRGYCPIPREQRFLNLFNKLNQEKRTQIFIFKPSKLITISIILIILLNEIENILFTFNKSIFENTHFLNINIFNIFPIIIFSNLLSLWLVKDWTSLKKKSKQTISIYEELGSIESQIWKKPIVTLIQDNLILNFKINPLLRKLFYQTAIYNLIILLILILTIA